MSHYRRLADEAQSVINQEYREDINFDRLHKLQREARSLISGTKEPTDG